MTAAGSKPPVLILGSYITALGTMRSLAAAGVRSRCISSQQNFVRLSRFYRRPPSGVDFVEKVADLPAYLEQLPVERAVLMPCSDEWVAAVAELDDRLRERFPSSQPCRDTLSFFLDKGKLEAKLAELEIPRPLTVLVTSKADLDRVDNDLFERLFMKPRLSRPFFLAFGVKAFHLHSAKDAAERLAACRDCGFGVMLQEYLPGPASRHYFIDGFVDRHGEIRAVFARQRIRMYPLDFGDSSYMTTVPVEKVAQAVDSMRKLLPAVNYRGIFSAEFKLDGRDDTYKLIEVNTRPWTYINFDSRHGMNMAEMSYRDALGLEVPTVPNYRVGASMVYLPNDLLACWSLWRRGDIGLAGWLSSWLKARSAVFSPNDPLPSLPWWWNVVGGRLKGSFSRRKEAP